MSARRIRRSGRTVDSPHYAPPVGPAPDVPCDYCGRAAELVTGEDLYPHRRELHDKRAWKCWPCNAHVGCHDGTEIPLGRLANAELRRMRKLAHDAFDPIWFGGAETRVGAYDWLAEELKIPREDCHISRFDVALCRRAIQVCNARLGVGTRGST